MGVGATEPTSIPVTPNVMLEVPTLHLEHSYSSSMKRMVVLYIKEQNRYNVYTKPMILRISISSSEMFF